MYKDLLPNVDMFVAPLVKTNKLAIANLEKLVAFQMSSLQTYVDISLAQMKAAAEVSDLQELQTFYKNQLEVAANLRQKVMDDVKTLADLGNGFKDDFTKLAEENASTLKVNVEKVTKKAA